MIGVVVADPATHEIVREFFELFKTPWEFYRQGRSYDVLICAGDVYHRQYEQAAKVTFVYGGKRLGFDVARNIETGAQPGRDCVVSRHQDRIPIYGETITFPRRKQQQGDDTLLTEEESRHCVAFVERSAGRSLVRVGYDLFEEVRTLLTIGQPPANASLPALDLHIAFLRDIIIGCGLPLVEVPPVPDGYRFIACLTHDVDHPSIRRHKWDHTVAGFLSRALFGSLRDVIRGRLSVRGLAANWTAALKLPFVYMGLAKDFWRDFGDRYLDLEEGVPSTFFVIPFAGRPGRTPNERALRLRGAGYGAKDIADIICKLKAAGCEIGLHGIDAWADSSAGREELNEIQELTGASKAGVRMHWLYFDQKSPSVLEDAGIEYDSTVGYNETVGYRAGTTQAYRPPGVNWLMELPLHAMDTALFYPSYLGKSSTEAKVLLGRLVKNASRLGGSFTVNWHDRSLSPERLWDESYRDLVQDLKAQEVWFATAAHAVSWFRRRRSVEFEVDCADPSIVRARVTAASDTRVPGLRLRMHKLPGPEGYEDTAFDESAANSAIHVNEN